MQALCRLLRIVVLCVLILPSTANARSHNARFDPHSGVNNTLRLLPVNKNAVQFPCGVHCTKNTTTGKYTCNGGGPYKNCWTNTDQTTCLVSVPCRPGPGIIIEGATPLLTADQIRQVALTNSTAAGVLARIRDILKNAPMDQDYSESEFSYCGRAYSLEDVETILGNDPVKQKQLADQELDTSGEVVLKIQVAVSQLGTKTIILKPVPGTGSWPSPQVTVEITAAGVLTTTEQ